MHNHSKDNHLGAAPAAQPRATIPPRCVTMVPWDSWGHTKRCERAAKRDGFCAQHHPDAVKARQDKAAAKYRAESTARMAAHEQDRANARDAARYRYLQSVVEGVGFFPKGVAACRTVAEMDAIVDGLIANREALALRERPTHD